MRTTKKEMLKDTQGVISSKLIDRNTLKIEYANGTSAIRLHKTDIITFNKDRVILNSGGWRTVTTKDRINKFSPVKIYQQHGIWYLQTGEMFFDGITVRNGKPTKTKKVNLAKIERMKKQINKFVSQITKDNLPVPSSGDCWLCSFHTEDGKTWGEVRNGNADHLAQHLKENYLHGSLLVNAMHSVGYRDEQIGVHYALKFADTFRRATRKYLQKNLLEIAVR